MTSDAPQSQKNGSVTDSTSSSPGTAGTRTREAWVVGEPSSADPNPENSQQDVESIPVVEIRYPKGIEMTPAPTDAESNAETGGRCFSGPDCCWRLRIWCDCLSTVAYSTSC